MNKIIFNSIKLPEEIDNIIKKYGNNYKSLNSTYKILIDASQLSSSYEEKKLKVAEENEKLKKEMKETEEKHLKEIKEKDDLIESLKKQLLQLNTSNKKKKIKFKFK